MKKILLVVITGFTAIACVEEKRHPPVITIVDIGHDNRLKLGQELRVIRKYSHRVVALDFYLTPDSLDIDTILVKELGKLENTVQVLGLHDFVGYDDEWDSLEVSHAKFPIADHGFSNLSA